MRQAILEPVHPLLDHTLENGFDKRTGVLAVLLAAGQSIRDVDIVVDCEVGDLIENTQLSKETELLTEIETW